MSTLDTAVKNHVPTSLIEGAKEDGDKLEYKLISGTVRVVRDGDLDGYWYKHRRIDYDGGEYADTRGYRSQEPWSVGRRNTFRSLKEAKAFCDLKPASR